MSLIKNENKEFAEEKKCTIDIYIRKKTALYYQRWEVALIKDEKGQFSECGTATY